MASVHFEPGRLVNHLLEALGGASLRPPWGLQFSVGHWDSGRLTLLYFVVHSIHGFCEVNQGSRMPGPKAGMMLMDLMSTKLRGRRLRRLMFSCQQIMAYHVVLVLGGCW